MAAPDSRRNILILCVDRDDDIGRKTGIETPILGRDANFEAASRLALADPEEADANAMFAAVSLYDRLTAEGEDAYQLATIAGSQEGGIEADRSLIHELGMVLERFPSREVILVTDGFADEFVVPIIQSRIQITSIRRVVVKHSERIEESWAIFLRYMKTLFNDPHYSRFSLGVPGILLIVLGFLIVFDQLQNAGMIIPFIVGMTLLLRGFGIDKKLSSLRFMLPPPERQLVLASIGAGLILSVMGCYLGVVEAVRFIPENSPPFWSNIAYWIQLSPLLVGNFLLKATDLIVFGTMVALLGGFVSYFIQGDPRRWRNIVGLIVTFWLRFIAIESSKLLNEPGKPLTLTSPLVLMTIWGFITTIISVIILYGLHKKFM